MAEFVESQDDEVVGDEFQAEEVKSQSAPPPEEPAIPEKYKGKSMDDIIKMHQEAEKLIGRQAQEVGEVRKLADDLIKQQLNKKEDTQPRVEDNEIDYFADPDKAVNRAVENNPIVKQLKEQQEMQRRQQQAAQLQAPPRCQRRHYVW